MRLPPIAIAGFFLIHCIGCASVSGVSNADASSQRAPIVSQFILKFKAAAQGCDAAGIVRLAADTHLAIAFVRPMSGTACVVRLSSRSADAVLEEQKILQSHPAIESLELDRVMKAL